MSSQQALPTLSLQMSLNGENLGAQAMPMEEILKFQVDITSGKPSIYQISEDKLLPNTRAQYDKLLKDNPPRGRKPAIYVNPFIGFSAADGFASYIDIPDMGLKGHDNKKLVTGPVIFISEAGHKWTEKDVPSLSEKELLNLYAVFSPKNEDQKQFVEAFTKMAKEKNLIPTPTLLLTPPNSPAAASALLSKEGKQFVLIDPSIPLKQLLALADHETAHLKNGDLKTANAVKAHNSNDVAVAMEKAADNDAIKNCRTSDLSSYLKTAYNNYTNAIGSASLEQTNASLKKLDPKHPAPLERLQYLDAAVANPPPGCKPTKTGRTP